MEKILSFSWVGNFYSKKKAAGLALTDGLNGLIKHIIDCIRKFRAVWQEKKSRNWSFLAIKSGKR